MSLPWFPFNIKDFLANTKRLNTEAKGAYLCLMLDYYEQEAPAPDDDDVLAAICELPVEAWKRHRKVIAPLFDVRDGHWHHARIEHEMLEAQRKHSSSIARASAGGHARWAGKPPKLVKPPKKATFVPPDATSTAQAQPEAQPTAQPEQCLGDAHLHKQYNSLSGSKSDLEGTGAEAAEPAAKPEGLGEPITEKFWPCPNHLTMCRVDGADDETIKAEVNKFILHHLNKGSWSHDWDASFATWWHRWREHRAKQKPAKTAAPRVEVNVEPTLDHWRNYLTRWKSDSFWPRAGGPDPSTGRCKAPAALFDELGIDPKTGLPSRHMAHAK